MFHKTPHLRPGRTIALPLAMRKHKARVAENAGMKGANFCIFMCLNI